MNETWHAVCMYVGFHPAREGDSPRKIGWGCMASFPKPLPYSRQFPSKRTCNRFAMKLSMLFSQDKEILKK